MSETRGGADSGLPALLQALLPFAALAAVCVVFRDVADPPNVRPYVGFDEGEQLFFSLNETPNQVVVATVAILLFMDRARLYSLAGAAGQWAIGVPLLVLSILAYAWGWYTQTAHLHVVSLGCFMQGAGLLLGGRPLARALAVPTALLLFAIPLPTALINQIIFPLQGATVWLSDWMLRVVGYDYVTSGDLIFGGGRIFHVIETCSGLRAIHTLLMSTVIYMGFFYVRGVHALLLAVAAPLIAFFYNGIRVVSIVLLPTAAMSEDHTLQGLIALVVGVVTLHGVSLAIERVRGIPMPDGPRAITPNEAATPTARRAALLALFAVLALLATLHRTLEPWKPAPRISEWAVRLAPLHAGYRGRNIELDQDFLGSVQFTRQLRRVYEQDGVLPVEILIGFNARLGHDRSMLSEKMGIPSSGHEVVDAYWSTGTGELEGVPLRVVVTDLQGRRYVSYSWYRDTADWRFEVFRAFFGLDRSGWHRAGGAYAVRITTELGGREPDLAAARARLDEFVALAVASLPPRTSPEAEEAL